MGRKRLLGKRKSVQEDPGPEDTRQGVRCGGKRSCDREQLTRTVLASPPEDLMTYWPYFLRPP